MKFVNKNYYELLDIEPRATEEQVRRAYRQVRTTWNPDSIAIYSLYTPEESAAIRHKIEEAYQVLSDPQRRANYDRYLSMSVRGPTVVRTPEAFWDLVHGFMKVERQVELMQNVSELLNETPEAEVMLEQLVMEGTSGGTHSIEVMVREERPETNRLSPQARGQTPGPNPALARVMEKRTQPQVRERREGMPSAPAAPPIPPPPAPERLSSASWTPAASPRDVREGTAVPRPTARAPEELAARTPVGRGETVAEGAPSANSRKSPPSSPNVQPIPGNGLTGTAPSGDVRVSGAQRSAAVPLPSGPVPGGVGHAGAGNHGAGHGAGIPGTAAHPPSAPSNSVTPARADVRAEPPRSEPVRTEKRAPAAAMPTGRAEEAARAVRSGVERAGAENALRLDPVKPTEAPRAAAAPASSQTAIPSPSPDASISQSGATGGWTRSYATSFKPTRPLPERAISPEQLAELESRNGMGGKYLKALREFKGVTLADIAERTKIQTTYLKYMEEDRFGELPPAVYVEGFVNQVARLLKLDVKHTVAGYMRHYQNVTSGRNRSDDPV